MHTDRRESIRLSLRNLAEAHAAAMQILEQTCVLVDRELALGSLEDADRRADSALAVSRPHFSVLFRGKACYLGNTRPFHFFERLGRQPNCYLSYEDLLSDVWDCCRADATVRSVVKVLHRKLRQAGLPELADAIDGTAAGHYALKLPVQ
jgi:hypothetical protein